MGIRDFFGQHKLALAIILGIMAITGLVVFAVGIRTVPSGYIGVKTRWGSIVGEEGEGFHWVNWILGENIISIDTQIHKIELANQSIGTNDQLEAWGTVALNYKLNETNVLEIYKTLRLDWEDRVILNNMQESLKGTTAHFRADEFLANRTQVKEMFESLLRERLAPYHIIVLDVQLENFRFSDAYQAQVNAKSTAEQAALEEKNNLEIVRYQQQQEILKQQANATMQKILAEATANATLTQAQADAEKTLMEATAQAEAQRLINAQLSDISAI